MPFFGEHALKLLARRLGRGGAVRQNERAVREVFGHPVGKFRRAGHADAHELDAAALQLVRGLHEVAAVRPEGGLCRA